MTTYHCSVCKQDKAPGAFGALKSQCLECRREKARNRYHKNRGVLLEKQAENRAWTAYQTGGVREPLEIRFAREVRKRKLLQLEVLELRQEIEAIKQKLSGGGTPSPL